MQLILSFIFQILIELHQLQKTTSMKAGTEKYFLIRLPLGSPFVENDRNQNFGRYRKMLQTDTETDTKTDTER